MKAFVENLIKKFAPGQYDYLKKKFSDYKKATYPKLTKEEFLHLLEHELGITTGKTVFIHSSMRKLFLDFSKKEILDILLGLVGEEGTLIFPCWQFNIRAEDYIKENDIVFDLKNTPSAMGRLTDVLRSMPGAYRSFHPTNSFVAIGKHAEVITAGHQNDIYPCGEQSPLVKMMDYDAIIVGIGVTVDNLTFVHAVEDTMKSDFPIKTRMDKIFPCNCIDAQGNEVIIETLVATTAVSDRDVTSHFNANVPNVICKRIQVKKMDFFSAKSKALFQKIKSLAQENKTIYLD